jgi:hypothetical protein
MNNSMTRKEIEERLIAKSWQDPAFKQKLINDPKSVLIDEGISLPDSVELRVIEENSALFCLVIPAQPIQASELSDAELESVAGGGPQWGSNIICIGKD